MNFIKYYQEYYYDVYVVPISIFQKITKHLIEYNENNRVKFLLGNIKEKEYLE